MEATSIHVVIRQNGVALEIVLSDGRSVFVPINARTVPVLHEGASRYYEGKPQAHDLDHAFLASACG